LANVLALIDLIATAERQRAKQGIAHNKSAAIVAAKANYHK
jgi:hypothetical protein